MSAVIEALRPNTHPRAAIDGAVYIPLALLAPSATGMQSSRRKHFDAKKLAELAESVTKHGVLQPILVRQIANAKTGQPLYEIVAGERRWRASTLAEVDAIPCIVREISDFDALELQVIENLQRDDLHPLEEAEGYEALMKKPDGLQGYATADELAARIGKSRSYVFGRLKLCSLVESARKAFVAGEINASVALLIARMPPSVQVEATKGVAHGWGGEPMSYRSARDYLERNHMLTLGSAPFKITDETLHPAAGSCHACGKRTGANPDLFEDIKSGDVCTDAGCFGEKKTAHQARLIEIAKAEGREVLTGAAAKKAMPREYSNELTGFLRLDDTDYRINGSKTIGKLLGKDAPPTVLIEHPRTKELIQAVRQDAAMQVLKEKGHVKTARVPSTNDAQRKIEAKNRAESAWRLAVAERTIAASADPKFDSDVVLRAWLVAEFGAAMYDRLEYETAKRVCKLLGWDEKLGRGYDGDSHAKVAKHFHALTGHQLEQAFVAMAIAGQLHVASYSSTKPTRLLEFAGHLGVDAAAVRAEQAAAARVKVAPKKKTAAKAKLPLTAATKKAAAKPLPRRDSAARAPAGAAAARYRNAETNETWSGRGLQPAWLKAALKTGRKLAEFDGHATVEPGLGAPMTPKQAKARGVDAQPIKVNNGSTLSPAAAWPFPGTKVGEAIAARAQSTARTGP